MPGAIDMQAALVAVFVIAYAAIAVEHLTKVNKSASALVCAGLLWTIYAGSVGALDRITEELSESLTRTAQIVFFLMGAMTVVEVMDAHNGFEIITRRIRTSSLSLLLWLVGFVTFFLSAILDNLTTTIVMVSLLRRLLARHEDRLFFAGIIVIAANAGGAWSPIGDVTTTMLWIGGQVTAVPIIKYIFLPSLLCLVVPLSITAFVLRGRRATSVEQEEVNHGSPAIDFERNVMFFLGLSILTAVPVFKTLTGLPPFMSILFGLGILWLVGDLMLRHRADDFKHHLTLGHALSRIDMSSIMFFVGILLAVATLEHSQVLAGLAKWLEHNLGRQDVIVLIIGIASAIVDNVPLVAASMGMYSMVDYPPDHFVWQFLAYCAGTGGSVLIVGSAAGIAAMGLEKINFFWYAKRISGLALIGYFAGAAAYLAQYQFFR
jgi:Na+/H+ antiporter NhaD/arsenite permease-like protein